MRRSILFGLAFMLLGAVSAFAAPTPLLSQRGSTPSGGQFNFDLGFDFLDFNYDGKTDILMPDTALTNSVAYLNEGTNAAPRYDRRVRYPINFTETWPQTVEHVQSYAIGDLNGDGRWDYVLYDGYLRYLPDSGSAHRPFHWVLPKGEKYYQYFPGSKAMMEENMRYVAGPQSFFWKDGPFARQSVTMTVADWDGDGLQDLLICRFKKEAPGVVPVGGSENWNSYGRMLTGTPAKQELEGAQNFSAPLTAAPERGLYFYKNVGTKTEPYFDQGAEITTPDGKSISAANPVVADMDGDGIADLLSCETRYNSNAFRIDWPVRNHLVWFKRAKKDDTAVLQPETPVTDAKGVPIPSGTMARVADLTGQGQPDLYVLDPAPKIDIRWYHNQAPARQKPRYEAPRTLTGQDFARLGMVDQPLVVDWFAPGSRDLIMHGDTDTHCKWGLRRTALYRNVAKGPDQVEYQFAGYLNFEGDLEMVPASMEDDNYDCFGTAVGFYRDGQQKYLVMAVAGRLFHFSNLDKDGLTFHKRIEFPIKTERNHWKGWQDIPVKAEQPIKFLRIDNSRNGMGLGRDGFLHVVRLEIYSNGQNIATPENIAGVESHNLDDPNKRNTLLRPQAMLDPNNEAKAGTKNFTTWGSYMGPMTIELKTPTKVDKVRFLLSDREELWFDNAWPFYWQGKLYHPGAEQGQTWYQYKVESSADGTKWDNVVDRSLTDMNRCFPFMVDWNKDGKIDMLLGVQIATGRYPRTKEYRLYLNHGTNETPVYDDFQYLLTEKGVKISNDADWGKIVGCLASIFARDLDGDGKLDIVVEGYTSSEMMAYRNISEKPDDLKFQYMSTLGGSNTVRFRSGYPDFYYGEVDGDDIPDLLISLPMPMYYKGVSPRAPELAKNIQVTDSNKEGLQLQWTKPLGAVRYEIRWSEDEPVTDSNWGRLSKQEGEYGADALAVATVKPQTAGKKVFLAVKSLSAQGEYSPISDVVTGYALAPRQITLRNGLVNGTAEYSGTQAATLDASKPNGPPAKADSLQVLADDKAPQEILLRFNDLPQGAPLAQAKLTLTTRPLPENYISRPVELAVSCNVIRDDWAADKATWREAAPGVAWNPKELAEGGEFISMPQALLVMQPRQKVEWDITEAVNKARQQGKTSLSLLVRADYTGHYFRGYGYDFEGPLSPWAIYRPQLTLIEK